MSKESSTASSISKTQSDIREVMSRIRSRMQNRPVPNTLAAKLAQKSLPSQREPSAPVPESAGRPVTATQSRGFACEIFLLHTNVSQIAAEKLPDRSEATRQKYQAILFESYQQPMMRIREPFHLLRFETRIWAGIFRMATRIPLKEGKDFQTLKQQLAAAGIRKLCFVDMTRNNCVFEDEQDMVRRLQSQFKNWSAKLRKAASYLQDYQDCRARKRRQELKMLLHQMKHQSNMKDCWNELKHIEQQMLGELVGPKENRKLLLWKRFSFLDDSLNKQYQLGTYFAPSGFLALLQNIPPLNATRNDDSRFVEPQTTQDIEMGESIAAPDLTPAARPVEQGKENVPATHVPEATPKRTVIPSLYSSATLKRITNIYEVVMREMLRKNPHTVLTQAIVERQVDRFCDEHSATLAQYKLPASLRLLKHDERDEVRRKGAFARSLAIVRPATAERGETQQCTAIMDGDVQENRSDPSCQGSIDFEPYASSTQNQDRRSLHTPIVTRPTTQNTSPSGIAPDAPASSLNASKNQPTSTSKQTVSPGSALNTMDGNTSHQTTGYSLEYLKACTNLCEVVVKERMVAFPKTKLTADRMEKLVQKVYDHFKGAFFDRRELPRGLAWLNSLEQAELKAKGTFVWVCEKLNLPVGHPAPAVAETPTVSQSTAEGENRPQQEHQQQEPRRHITQRRYKKDRIFDQHRPGRLQNIDYDSESMLGEEQPNVAASAASVRVVTSSQDAAPAFEPNTMNFVPFDTSTLDQQNHPIQLPRASQSLNTSSTSTATMRSLGGSPDSDALPHVKEEPGSGNMETEPDGSDGAETAANQRSAEKMTTVEKDHNYHAEEQRPAAYSLEYLKTHTNFYEFVVRKRMLAFPSTQLTAVKVEKLAQKVYDHFKRSFFDRGEFPEWLALLSSHEQQELRAKGGMVWACERANLPIAANSNPMSMTAQEPTTPVDRGSTADIAPNDGEGQQKDQQQRPVDGEEADKTDASLSASALAPNKRAVKPGNICYESDTTSPSQEMAAPASQQLMSQTEPDTMTFVPCETSTQNQDDEQQQQQQGQPIQPAPVEMFAGAANPSTSNAMLPDPSSDPLLTSVDPIVKQEPNSASSCDSSGYSDWVEEAIDLNDIVYTINDTADEIGNTQESTAAEPTPDAVHDRLVRLFQPQQSKSASTVERELQALFSQNEDTRSTAEGGDNVPHGRCDNDLPIEHQEELLFGTESWRGFGENVRKRRRPPENQLAFALVEKHLAASRPAPPQAFDFLLETHIESVRYSQYPVRWPGCNELQHNRLTMNLYHRSPGIYSVSLRDQQVGQLLGLVPESGSAGWKALTETLAHVGKFRYGRKEPTKEYYRMTVAEKVLHLFFDTVPPSCPRDGGHVIVLGDRSTFPATGGTVELERFNVHLHSAKQPSENSTSNSGDDAKDKPEPKHHLMAGLGRAMRQLRAQVVNGCRR